jgi:hypothetical protein
VLAGDAASVTCEHSSIPCSARDIGKNGVGHSYSCEDSVKDALGVSTMISSEDSIKLTIEFRGWSIGASHPDPQQRAQPMTEIGR